MSTKESGSNLVQALKELSLRWQQTKVHWHDVKSQQFEREYLESLPDHVQRTMGVMMEIDTVLKKIRSDCE
jgi:uncharacterized protein (UPF0216 family)